MPLLTNIPGDLKQGLKEINYLGDEDFLKLIDNLNATKNLTTIEKLAEELEIHNIQTILELIGKLQLTIDEPSLIEEVINDLTNLSLEEGLIKKENLESYHKKLSILLNDEKIYLAAKAEELQNNFSNRLLVSRVVTDLRPVFSMDAESEPKAGIVMHTLHLHYDSSEEPFHRTVAISLTHDDILNLQVALDRAEEKEKTLYKLADKIGLLNINPNKEDDER